jgi:hypothetical protein
MIKEGKTQFVILRISNLETIVICNVWRAGNSRDIATTWKLFLDKNLEATYNGGNFNNLKVVEKMDSVGSRFMLKKEVTVWHHMTLKYGLLHTWQLAEA